jgi:hypothetical protein
MTDYSSWSHQQMYDAVLSADPAAMANAASHWTQCAGNWATGSWGVSDGLEKLIPQWSGQGASACYGWTTDLLDRNIAFQGSLNQASKVMLDLSRSVYQAQISMPEVPDADIQAAANGQPTLAQLKAAAQQNGLLPNSHTALAGAMDDITLPLAQKDPNSPIHQAAVAAAQQQVNAARGQAIQVAQTLHDQYTQAGQQMRTINAGMQNQNRTGYYGGATKISDDSSPGSSSLEPGSRPQQYGTVSGQSNSSRGPSGDNSVSGEQAPPQQSQVPQQPVRLYRQPPPDPQQPDPRPPSATRPVIKPPAVPTSPQQPPTTGLKDWSPPTPSMPSPPGVYQYTTPPNSAPSLNGNVGPTGTMPGWGLGPSSGWPANDSTSTSRNGLSGPEDGVSSPEDGWSAGGGWGDDCISGGMPASGGPGSRRVASAYGNKDGADAGADGAGGSGSGSSGSGSGSSSAAAAGEEAGVAAEGEGGTPMGMMGGMGGAGGGSDQQRGQRPGYLLNDDPEYWTGSKVKRAAPPGGVIE